jgi:RHS repeat-associated protein
LYYLRARYYDSKIGRFISRDPIDITDNVNLYSYVGNNPINYNDLEGLLAKEFAANTLDATM